MMVSGFLCLFHQLFFGRNRSQQEPLQAAKGPHLESFLQSDGVLAEQASGQRLSRMLERLFERCEQFAQSMTVRFVFIGVCWQEQKSAQASSVCANAQKRFWSQFSVRGNRQLSPMNMNR